MSFKELDDKARYWVTITLPSFLALSAYLLESYPTLGQPVICAGSALATCLLFSSLMFASVLLSERVESGVLVPPDHDFGSAKAILEKDVEWYSLVDKQAYELVRAIKVNEGANNKKSRRLWRAETSLFLATPAAVVFATGSAFAYAAAGPIGTATTAVATAGVVDAALATFAGIGFVNGAFATAAALWIRHLLALRRKSTNSSP